MTDPLVVLTHSDWQTTENWFGDTVVVLRPTDKLSSLDTAGLSWENQARAIEGWLMARTEGERIHFSDRGVLEYSYRMSCPVGEVLRKLKAFRIQGDTVHVEYSLHDWNEEPIYEESDYRIRMWERDGLVLVLL